MAEAVSVKLPEFWPEEPDVWFIQAEAEFDLRKITQDSTKYSHVVTKLDRETASKLRDFLRAPPADNKYAALKGKLVNRYSLTPRERAKHLLSLPGLGDGKPSDLMDKMLQLRGDGDLEFLFRELFEQHLPPNVRATLANVKTEDYRQLARTADDIYEAHKTHHPSLSSTSTTQISAVKVCYYHTKFGEKAKKCFRPCSYKPSIVASTSRSHGTTNSNLFFLHDNITGQQFLVDTGATVSAIPPTQWDLVNGTKGPQLAAANGSQIETFGTRMITLHIGSETYSWPFIVAKVTRPLLGADFLCNAGLMVDVKNKRLVNSTTFESVKMSAAHVSGMHLTMAAGISDDFSKIFSSFPALTTPTFKQSKVK